MARAIATDPYQVFNFWVSFTSDVGIQAGFTRSNIPELTVDASEYKTGTMTYKRKYPGIPTVNELTMSTGLMKADSAIFKQIKKSLTQGGEYRFDFDIIQNHRDGSQKSYKIYEAFCHTFKPSSDLEANSNDVAIEELGITFESFDIVETAGASTTHNALLAS
jgi:phage tail-like protein